MKTVLAIDPGSAKCGMAVVSGHSEKSDILSRKVVELPGLAEALRNAEKEFHPNLVVVGGGTNSRKVQSVIRESLPGKALLILDEKYTTVRARERYWQHTIRRGWRRLLPSSMQVPPVPIDDFVAVILAEQALSVD